jgi:hypothetical protein
VSKNFMSLKKNSVVTKFLILQFHVFFPTITQKFDVFEDKYVIS